MTPELFEQIGEAIYGAEWRLPLSRDLGVSYQSIRRWKTAKQPVPAGVEEELRRLLDEALVARRAEVQAIEAVRLALNLAIHQEVTNG